MMKKLRAPYTRDSEKYHVFSFDHKKRIVGRVYVFKGDKIPDVVKIHLEPTEELEEQEKKKPTRAAKAGRLSLRTND